MRILLDNALRIAPAGSAVTLDPHGGGSWVEIAVSDHGPGVSPQERELIFERFQRGSATGGRSGFGLGLAIGRELATRMGGSLQLADATKSGATFALRLPAAIAAGVEERAHA